ncbi:MAG: ATP12 family protein [Pseudomonadota bacterium]
MKDILGERDPAVPQTPTRVAEPSRESQLPKRFYKQVGVSEDDGGYQILLDGSKIKTPGRETISVSNRSVADAVAREWDAQGERIDPMTMPLTRLVNTAIDGVAQDLQAVKEDIIKYSGTDMLCYRAASPEPLVERQRGRWDPLIDWAQASLGARFDLAEGVMHVEQPPETIAAFSVHVGALNEPLLLTATHVVTTLTGSAILAMALVKGEVDVETAWSLAHLDEDWNIEQWGADEEAEARRAVRYKDMQAAGLIVQAM